MPRLNESGQEDLGKSRKDEKFTQIDKWMDRQYFRSEKQLN